MHISCIRSNNYGLYDKNESVTFRFIVSYIFLRLHNRSFIPKIEKCHNTKIFFVILL